VHHQRQVKMACQPLDKLPIRFLVLDDRIGQGGVPQLLVGYAGRVLVFLQDALYYIVVAQP